MSAGKWVLLGIAALAITWLLLYSPPDQAPPRSGAPAAGPVLTTPAAPLIVASERSAANPMDIAEGSVLAVRVVDSAGQEAPHAIVECVPPGRTVLAVTVVGEQVDGQWARLDKDHLRNLAATHSGALLRAREQHCTSTGVPLAPLLDDHDSTRGPVTLQLRAAASQAFIVLEEATGKPVENVQISLSAASQTTDAPADAQLHFAGAGAGAIFSTVTAADGRCELHGLPPGNYSVAVRTPWPLAVQRAPLQHGTIVVPGPEISMALGTMHASVLKCVGKPILTWNANPADVNSSDASQGHLLTETRRLQRSGDTVAWVGFPRRPYARNPSQPRPPPRVRFRILLDGVGWVERVVECRPLSSDFAPEVLDTTSLPAQNMFGKTIFVPTRDGARLADHQVLPDFVLEHGGRIPDWSLPGVWNKEVSIPLGKARVRFLDPILARTQRNQQLEIQDRGGTTTTEISLPIDHVPIKLEPKDTDGSKMGHVALTVSQGDTVIQASLRDNEDWIWMPAGDVTLSVTTRGFKTSVVQVAIRSPGQVIAVTLQPDQ